MASTHAAPADQPAAIRARAASLSVGSASSARWATKTPCSAPSDASRASAASTRARAATRRRCSLAGSPSAGPGTRRSHRSSTASPRAKPRAARTAASSLPAVGGATRGASARIGETVTRASRVPTAPSAASASGPVAATDTVSPRCRPSVISATGLRASASRSRSRTMTVAAKDSSAATSRAAGRACRPCSNGTRNSASTLAALPSTGNSAGVASATAIFNSGIPISIRPGAAFQAIVRPIRSETTIGVMTLGASWATRSRSKASSGWPGTTVWPSATSRRNTSPPSATVSMPTWIRSSPAIERSVTAWAPCGGHATVPAHGAWTVFPVGSIARPSPASPAENTGSGTSASGRTQPGSGAHSSIVDSIVAPPASPARAMALTTARSPPAMVLDPVSRTAGIVGPVGAPPADRAAGREACFSPSRRAGRCARPVRPG